LLHLYLLELHTRQIKKSVSDLIILLYSIYSICFLFSEFNGYTIPEGTVLLANLYGVHHDPRYWEKPMEFLPERFLHSDGTLKTSDAFIPFSVG